MILFPRRVFSGGMRGEDSAAKGINSISSQNNASRRAIHEHDGMYFITITCAKWQKLLEITNGYDVVYNWFDYLKGKGHYINGYVIMPNHIHALISFRNTGKSINSIIGNGKRFMAYQLVNKLQYLCKAEILEELGSIVNKTDRKRGKLHEVFEPSFDWKECRGSKFVKQKLNYIHDNPCQERWKLAARPDLYLHSSALFYILDKEGVYQVTSYTEMEDIDLTQRLIK